MCSFRAPEGSSTVSATFIQQASDAPILGQSVSGRERDDADLFLSRTYMGIEPCLAFALDLLMLLLCLGKDSEMLVPDANEVLPRVSG